ncbi:MAG: DUF3866 family protein [Acidimicrobiia bacterium]|nr:DUF3866 family protein [Acidimicrobiia bacterium]
MATPRAAVPDTLRIVPSFRTGEVLSILHERAGLQRVEVDLGGGAERAYVLTQLTGDVAPGDRVVVNTTAVELGLGTGGWHVVHWNAERSEWSEPGPGHIIKARYTSLQADVGSTEEHAEHLAEVESIDGMPVVAAALHSQVPAVAVGVKERRPDARLAYVMTDGAALPLALSDVVADLRAAGLLDASITCGHAFGGDYEAVSVFSALAVARHVIGADVAVVAMGPGIVGTGTRLGFSGLESGQALDAVTALGGVAIACLRASFADPRPRHVTVSHHTLTTLRLAARERALVPIPLVGGAKSSGSARPSRDPASVTATTSSTSTCPMSSRSSTKPGSRSTRWDGPQRTIPCFSRRPPLQGASLPTGFPSATPVRTPASPDPDGDHWNRPSRTAHQSRGDTARHPATPHHR